jgi:hypothetical protein
VPNLKPKPNWPRLKPPLPSKKTSWKNPLKNYPHPSLDKPPKKASVLIGPPPGKETRKLELTNLTSSVKSKISLPPNLIPHSLILNKEQNDLERFDSFNYSFSKNSFIN